MRIDKTSFDKQVSWAITTNVPMSKRVYERSGEMGGKTFGNKTSLREVFCKLLFSSKKWVYKKPKTVVQKEIGSIKTSHTPVKRTLDTHITHNTDYT